MLFALVGWVGLVCGERGLRGVGWGGRDFDFGMVVVFVLFEGEGLGWGLDEGDGCMGVGGYAGIYGSVDLGDVAEMGYH